MKNLTRATSIPVFIILCAACALLLCSPQARAATFAVTNTSDAGAGSLRQAILDANASPGADTIEFTIGTGLHRIQTLSALPQITEQVTINGYSQPGSAPPAETTPAVICIELDGAAGAGDGLGFAASASNSVVRGLAIFQFPQNGIAAAPTTTGIHLEGNLIGLEASGTPRGNGASGVYLNLASSCTVGGTAFEARNVISGHGNSCGVMISGGSMNEVTGNFIGTTVGGDSPAGNRFGVYLDNTSSAAVGGAGAAGRNVISANAMDGVEVVGGNGDSIANNLIGLDSTGVAALGNGVQGVNARNGSTNVRVGLAGGLGNVISGNGGSGVVFDNVTNGTIHSNRIGTNAAGDAPLANAGSGVTMTNNCSNVQVGWGEGLGNVISGNAGDGVTVESSTAVTVAGNVIGMDAPGAAAVGNGGNGLSVSAFSGGVTVGGSTPGYGNLVSGNTGDGVAVQGCSNNQVYGNLIGTDAAGSTAFGNEGNGVSVTAECTGNIIGGSAPGQGNIISGNELSGVCLDGCFDGAVQSNLIGTASSGTSALPNMLGGVTIQNGASRNTIGGTSSFSSSGGFGTVTSGQGNVISGNIVYGVAITNSPGNQVLGNLIGTDSSGLAGLGNFGWGVFLGSSNTSVVGDSGGAGNVIASNFADGVYLDFSTGCSVGYNLIGLAVDQSPLPNNASGVLITEGSNGTIVGGTGAAANKISSNGENGVGIGASTDCVVSYNTIWNNSLNGVVLFDSDAFRNAISRNSIYGNQELGISFGGGATPTPNDGNNNNPAKPNRGYNYPVFSSPTYPVGGGTVAVSGTAPPDSLVELFKVGPSADASGHGQGKTFLAAVSADASSAFSAVLNGLVAGDRLCATATSPAGDPSGQGNTSEFSANAQIVKDSPQVDKVSPSSGPPGTQVTVTGSNFGAAQGGSTITVGGVEAAVVSWSDTRIVIIVPDGTEGGAVVVTTAAGGSNEDKDFTVVLSSWYLAEGTTAWGFSTYITIENPNQRAVTARVTYMDPNPASGKGRVLPPRDIILPPRSQTTVDPRWDLGNTDFSTRVECLEGRNIAVDRTMFWVGEGAASPEAHSSIGVSVPSRTWFLPEGSSAWGFETWTLIENPSAAEAGVELTYMVEGQGPVTLKKTVAPYSRATYSMAQDLQARVDASVQVESDTPVIVEGSMYRNNRREGSCTVGTTAPSLNYYLAEGTTAWGFTTYLLIQNPNDAPATVTVFYLTPGGPVQKDPFTMEPNSRKTIRVNDVDGLKNTDTSIQVYSPEGIIAARSMYWDNGTGEACHASIGLAAPHRVFYLPDGQTSGGWQTYTLVENPNETDVAIRVTYFPQGGGTPVTFTDDLPADTRRTYDMADKVASGRASIMVQVTDPAGTVMVERSMYCNDRGGGTDTIGGFTD